MRGRLIELLSAYRTPICEGLNGKLPDAEGIADYLIKNGVIVLPCKIGQTLYYHFQFTDKRILPFVERAKVARIWFTSQMRIVVDAELLDAKEKGIIRPFRFGDFGKTVFLTREEAEAKLAEIGGGAK